MERKYWYSDESIFEFCNVTINNKIDLKLCLTKAIKRTHKEFTLKTISKTLKELEEERTNKGVYNNFKGATSILWTWKKN